MSRPSTTFVTDTATMCVFDPVGLLHKLGDSADWWSLPEAELDAVNAGQAAFLNLGSDGAYTVQLHEQIDEPVLAVNLAVVSGRVFIGAAEEVTADGLEPEGAFGGMFFSLPIGSYTLLARREANTIALALVPAESCSNGFPELLRL